MLLTPIIPQELVAEQVAGTGAVQDPQLGQVIIDTSTTPPTFRGWDGVRWRTLTWEWE